MTLVLDRRVRRKRSTSKGSGSRCGEIGLFAIRPCVFKGIEPRYTGDCEGASPRSENCVLPLHSACCCTWHQTSRRTSIAAISLFSCFTIALHRRHPLGGRRCSRDELLTLGSFSRDPLADVSRAIL